MPKQRRHTAEALPTLTLVHALPLQDWKADLLQGAALGLAIAVIVTLVR